MAESELHAKGSAIPGCWLVLAAVAAWTSPVEAVSYYVSDAAGDDARTATEARKAGSPWKTIQRAAKSMQPGDRCVIRAGIYRERVIPGDGQRFEAHPGEVPLITGCDLIGGWKVHDDAIYKAPVGEKVVDVFLDGHNMDKARYPDDDGNRFNKTEWLPTVVERGRGDGGTVTFTGGLDLNYVGGFFTGLNGNNPYQANMGVIAGQNGARLTIKNTNHRWNHSLPGQFDGPGAGYITDHLNALTSPREWHWEGGTLYFHAPGGGNPGEKGTVEARVRLWGFDCSGKRGVEIVGLRFQAASILMRDSQDCTIDRCVFRYVSPWGREFYTYGRGRQADQSHYNYGDHKDGTSGIHISGSGNTIRNCYVAHGWGALISLRGKNNTAENNFVEEANWQCRQDAVCITVSGAHHKVLRNTLRKSNSMLICLRDIGREPLIAPRINYNDCRDYGYVMLDGGTAAIYCNANDDLRGGEFAHNFIAGNRATNHRVSCGIYLDDGAQNAIVHHNVIHGGGRMTSGALHAPRRFPAQSVSQHILGMRPGGLALGGVEGIRAGPGQHDLPEQPFERPGFSRLGSSGSCHPGSQPRKRSGRRTDGCGRPRFPHPGGWIGIC